ncbi:unnamed protein product [Caenorhabditis angaria]|uniref:RRP15-like protein n=1 Tax=Caenorhabditis angaria TaxID=860376 RepID=A0A9P1IQK3_9PELO|nr:unnamed protein product [Caenorhabditis angaria]
MGDRLEVTEDSDYDYERESDDSGEEGPEAARQSREDTIAFQNAPNALRQKRKIVKKLTRKEQSMKRSLKEYRVKLALVKPDIITDREKERNLRKLATKGVVQLFNAVSDRQKTMSDAVKEKMTARERKEARSRFDGKNFDVNKFGDEYGFGAKTEVKNESGNQEEMEEDQDFGDEIDAQNFSDED